MLVFQSGACGVGPVQTVSYCSSSVTPTLSVSGPGVATSMGGWRGSGPVSMSMEKEVKRADELSHELEKISKEYDDASKTCDIS